MRVDRSGESWLLSLAIGIVVNIVNSVISSAVVGEEYTLVNLAVDVASAAVNVIPSVGRWFSAAVSGIYTGYSTYQSGATLEGAIISGVIAGSLTAFSIGNLAEFDKSVFQIITNGVTDLVFGSGYAMISAAISKWQAIQGRSSPRRADTLKPTEN